MKPAVDHTFQIAGELHDCEPARRPPARPDWPVRLASLIRRAAGFTLLELMIVITIILILLSLGAGRYQQSVLRAKEAALHQDLAVMRKAIEQYTLDKQQAPQSLDDLVANGYLREIPADPITRKKDWRVDVEDILLSPEQTSTGVTDVHSNSPVTSPFENTPYSSW